MCVPLYQSDPIYLKKPEEKKKWVLNIFESQQPMIRQKT